MKKFLAMALTLALALTVLALPVSADEATETKTFSIWTWLGSAEGWGCQSYDEIPCFTAAEQATGIDITWEIESDTSTFDLMMSSGDTTDGIYYAWNPTRTAKYSAAGLIVDIAPYLEEYAPNLWALIQSDETIRKQLYSADGGIHFVPWITSDRRLVYGEGFGIRQDWLDKLGLAMPTTTDGLLEVLRQFRAQDANGNGENDEIITGYQSQLNKLTYAFKTADDYHYAEDGKTVVYGPMTDNYKEFLTFMNTLYAEGILDPDYFTNDSDIYMKKCQEDRVGLYCDNPGVFGTIMKDGEANGLSMDYAPMPWIGGYNLSSATRRYVQPYGVAISSSCEDVAGILTYLDYFFTEEGNTLLNWGIEGESYEIVDGVYQYTDVVTNNDTYEATTALSMYANPTFVGVQSADAQFELYNEAQQAFINTWCNADSSLAIEPFIAFTTEESDIDTQKATDLSTIQTSWRDKFITGDASIENDWETYLNDLAAYGVNDLLAIRQAASDRYQAK